VSPIVVLVELVPESDGKDGLDEGKEGKTTDITLFVIICRLLQVMHFMSVF